MAGMWGKCPHPTKTMLLLSQPNQHMKWEWSSSESGPQTFAMEVRDTELLSYTLKQDPKNR